MRGLTSWAKELSAAPYPQKRSTPGALLLEHVRPGMRVVKLGRVSRANCLAMAALAGEQGEVIVVDRRTSWRAALQRSAMQRDLTPRIHTRVGSWKQVHLADKADLVVGQYLASKQTNTPGFFQHIATMLRAGGRFLMIEHALSVCPFSYEALLSEAAASGFRIIEEPNTLLHRVAVLELTVR